MIDIDTFTRDLEKEFDDVEPNSLAPAMSYRDIPGFGSIHALIIIAFIDNKFDVLLSGQDLQSTQTITELYELVRSRTSE